MSTIRVNNVSPVSGDKIRLGGGLVLPTVQSLPMGEEGELVIFQGSLYAFINGNWAAVGSGEPTPPGAFSYNLTFSSIGVNEACSEITTNQYWSPSQSLGQGVELYFDEALTMRASNGWYSDFANAYEVDFNGTIQNVTPCGGGGGAFQYFAAYDLTDACSLPKSTFVWSDSSFLQNGSILYTDDTLTTPVADGFYVIQDPMTLQDVSYQVSGGNGEITNVAGCGASAQQFTMAYDEFDSAVACDGTPNVTVWNVGGLSNGAFLYQDEALTMPVANGWYSPDISNEVYFVDGGFGEIVDVRNCPRSWDAEYDEFSETGSCDNGTPVTVWQDGMTFVGLGQFFFTDSSLSQSVPDGWYNIIDDFGNTIKTFYIKDGLAEVEYDCAVGAGSLKTVLSAGNTESEACVREPFNNALLGISEYPIQLGTFITGASSFYARVWNGDEVYEVDANGEVIDINLCPPPVEEYFAGYSFTSAQTACGEPATQSVWTDTGIFVGGKLYSTDDLSAEVPDGWYAIDGFGTAYQTVSGDIVDEEACGGGLGEFELKGPKMTAEDACDTEDAAQSFFTDGNVPNPGTFLYQDDELVLPANDGFYSSPNSGQWFEVTGGDGEITDDGACS